MLPPRWVWGTSSLTKFPSVLFFLITLHTVFSQIPKHQEQPFKCRMFSQVNKESQEFYSPGYPNKYSNHTDCELRLEAEYGYLIQVDFRDYFELEPSEKCENDFLEIRDGPHGYSDLKGRYCGDAFPPIITSKDRHLWLRFSSDETLEYRGFRAVYKFLKNTQLDRPDIPPCRFESSGVQGLISHNDIPQYRHDYSLNYSVSLDCTWVIKVEPNKKIYLFFKEFELAEPNECDMNFVDIFGERLDLRSRLKHYCGSVGDAVTTSGPTMHFRFFGVKDALDSQFEAYYTAIRDRMSAEAEEDSECGVDEYDCEDATCIDKSLRCNGIKNCRHQYDEEGCGNLQKLKFDITSEHIIIILTIGLGLLAGMCFAMCFNCITKLVRDGRQIHENIRRSREQLEERRSTSVGSSPRSAHKVPGTKCSEDDGDYYVQNKPNGHTCIHAEDDTEQESEEESDLQGSEDFEESCVEMRDCECQTRDSIAQRDSVHRECETPPPPPPPTRRPPNLPPLSPISVPTPPPPPMGHYARHHQYPDVKYQDGSSLYGSTHSPYGSNHVNLSSSDHYEPNALPSDTSFSKDQFRAEAVIHMKEKPKYEASKSGKSTPDVLVTH